MPRTSRSDLAAWMAMELGDAPELTPQAFDVHVLIDDAARRFAQPAEVKGLSLEVKTAPTVPVRAIGEAAWLGEILAGLIDNAVRFTERGEVVASVTSSRAGRARMLLHAEVSDTGCGMPADLVERLFGPDARGGPAPNGATSTLRVARRLIELMDGQLGGSSAIGLGTTTWFTVPLDMP